MNLADKVRIAGSIVAEWPLETITSRSSRIAKAVAIIAIPIFTLLSLGYYAVHTYRYFSDRKFNAQVAELEWAIQSNQIEKVKDLFRTIPALKETLNGYQGRTPHLLHQAVDNERTDMIDLLIANGAGLDAQSRMGSPLAVAVYREKLNMVEFLLQRKADPNKGDGRRDLIYLACSEIEGPIKVDIVNLLLKNNANVPKANPFWSPLVVIASHWDTNQDKVRETLQLLLQKGARLGPSDVVAHPEARQFIDQFVN